MKNKSTSFLDFHLWIKNGYEREWIMTLPIKEMVDWWSPRRCHWISDDGSTEPLTNQLMRTTHYPPGRAGANVGEGVKRPIGYPPLPATPDQCIDRNDRNWLRSQKAFNSIGNSDQWLLSPFQPPPPSHTVFVESTRPGEDGGTEFPGRGGRNFLRTRVDQTRQFCVNNKRFGGALSNTFANSNGAAQLGPRFGQSVPVINLKDRNYLRILKKNSFSEKWWKSFFVIFLRSFNKESI